MSKILTVEDSYTPVAGTLRNINDALIAELTTRGHHVRLFDCRDGEGRKIYSAKEAAEIILEIVATEGTDSLLVDLGIHGDLTMGVEILRHLKRLGLGPETMRIAIYSKFLDDEQRRELRRLGVPNEAIFNRNITTMQEVARFF